MPPRILIAEDDDLQGAVLRSALEGRGYEAEIVTDGLQAVRRLRTGAYDLALLDYHLPEVDGLAAARLLHDHFAEDNRPGLIAVTATAEGLSEKEGLGGTSFDAVVSKRAGLPALLSVIDANLSSAAERHASAVIARGRAAVQDAEIARRRRRRAPLAAIPAMVMVTAFAAAFAWGVASLSQVGSTAAAAQRSVSLTTNSVALVGAMQDAETSQRTYLATGAASDLANFESDAQRVDQLLVGSAPLTADGTPGPGRAGPQDAIMPRLKVLASEAQIWHPGALEEGVTPSVLRAPGSVSEDHDTIQHLRDWASGLVTGSQDAVLSGLEAVRHNIVPVLAILALGIVYALWNAFQAVRRRWRAATPPPQPIGIWPRPVTPLRTSWAATPLLDSHAD
jgi:CheY-like chemotaxis protein